MTESSQEADVAWVLPDEPLPVRLMNTIWADRHGVHDALTTTTDLADWLRQTGASDHVPPTTAHDLVRARHLRDALRRLAALSTSDTRSAAVPAGVDPTGAVEVVNEVAAGLGPPRLELNDDLLVLGRRTGGRPVSAVLADVAVEAMSLLADPNGPPVRACYAPGCVLYFVQDHPRREWCSNACGNRARAARHYERHRTPTGRGKPTGGTPSPV